MKHAAGRLTLPSEIDVSDPGTVLSGMSLDTSVAPVKRFAGGETEARHRLKAFLAEGLSGYGNGRNRPEAAAASHLSPYLHFGQISPSRSRWRCGPRRPATATTRRPTWRS